MLELNAKSPSDAILKQLLQGDGQEGGDGDGATYEGFHEENESYLTLFHSLQVALTDTDYERKIDVFQKWFELEVTAHDMDVLEANHCLRRRLGTGCEAQEFYDLAEPGFVGILLNSTIPAYLQRLWMTALGKLEKVGKCHRLVHLLKMQHQGSSKSKWLLTTKTLLIAVCKIVLCHADIAKDVLLIYTIGKFSSVEAPEFIKQVYGTLIGTIVVSECVNLLLTASMLRNLSTGTTVKVLACLLSPLMPAVSVAMMSWWGFRLELLSCQPIEKMTCQVEKKQDYKARQSGWQNRFVAYKQNEISTEHFPQLIVLLILVLLPHSESATVDGLQTIFGAKGNAVFVLISSGMSFLTLIRSMLQKSASAKNDFLPFVGKLLLMTSFAIGIASRTVALVLYFAPTLGLFNLNMHWKMGRKEFARDNLIEYVRSASSPDTYNPVHISDRWVGTKEYTEFTVWPHEIYAMVLALMVVVHFCLVFVTKTLTNMKFKRDRASIQKFIHLLSNTVTFMPYNEWDDDLDSFSSFKDAWRRTCLENFLMNALIGVENALLCTPIWILLFRIARHEEKYLMKDFLPIMEEQLSRYRVTLLGITAPIFFVVIAPSLQCFLTYLYHRNGHPWSRIFKEEVKKRRNDETKKESEESERGKDDEQQIDDASGGNDDESADDDKSGDESGGGDQERPDDKLASDLPKEDVKDHKEMDESGQDKSNKEPEDMLSAEAERDVKK